MVDVLQKQLQGNEWQPSTAGLTILRPKPLTITLPGSYVEDMATLFQSKGLNLLHI
jgi:hypothetical protein